MHWSCLCVCCVCVMVYVCMNWFVCVCMWNHECIGMSIIQNIMKPQNFDSLSPQKHKVLLQCARMHKAKKVMGNLNWQGAYSLASWSPSPSSSHLMAFWALSTALAHSLIWTNWINSLTHIKNNHTNNIYMIRSRCLLVAFLEHLNDLVSSDGTCNDKNIQTICNYNYTTNTIQLRQALPSCIFLVW